MHSGTLSIPEIECMFIDHLDIMDMRYLTQVNKHFNLLLRTNDIYLEFYIFFQKVDSYKVSLQDYITNNLLSTRNSFDIFSLACYAGSNIVAKYIYKKYLPCEKCILTAQRLCCINNQFEIMYWLTNIIVTRGYPICFRLARDHNNLALAIWLYNLNDGIRISHGDIKTCYEKEYTYVLMWICCVNNNVKDFEYVLTHHNLSIFSWMLEFGMYDDIRKDNDYLLHYALKKKHTELLKLIVAYSKGEYELNIVDGSIVGCRVNYK